jgi:hypothetical protein
MPNQDDVLWVVDIKLLMVRENKAEVEEVVKAVLAWAKSTYSVDPYLDDIRSLPPLSIPPGLTRARATHNLHFAIFGRQNDCEFCQEMQDAGLG